MGRTPISSTGVVLHMLVVVFGGFVGTIPMAALTAVMIMVAIVAFHWHSVRPSPGIPSFPYEFLSQNRPKRDRNSYGNWLSDRGNA